MVLDFGIKELGNNQVLSVQEIVPNSNMLKGLMFLWATVIDTTLNKIATLVYSFTLSSFLPLPKSLARSSVLLTKVSCR